MIRVQPSSKGYYLGEFNDDGKFLGRQSGYFPTRRKAEEALRAMQAKRRRNSRAWKAMLHLFEKTPALQPFCVSPFIDLDEGRINKKKLIEATKGLAVTEKQMINLALSLAEIDRLDQNSQKIASESLRKCLGII